MAVINYISNIAIPFLIFIIVLYGLLEKKKVFDSFIEGSKEGIEIVFKIFPTLIGLFVAIGALRSSGLIDDIVKLINPILKMINIPSEIMPLAILRPISGSGSMAIATDIIQKYGVDSNIGVIAGTIMGSTETTLYTIAVYTSAVGIKKTRLIIIPALIADAVRNYCKHYCVKSIIVAFIMNNYIS